MSDEKKTDLIEVDSSTEEDTMTHMFSNLFRISSIERGTNFTRIFLSSSASQSAPSVPVPETSTAGTLIAKPIILACVVCRENQIQTVNFPCMHACFCLACAQPSLQHSQTCPQCRTPYEHIAMLYLLYSDHNCDQPLKKKQRVN